MRLAGLIAAGIASSAGCTAVPPSCPEGATLREAPHAEGRTFWCADSRGRQQGDWMLVTRSGALLMKRRYRDGILDGPAAGFYASGRKHALGAYRNGKKEGEWRFWQESGRPIAKGRYENGLRHGTWTLWDAKGTHSRRVDYVRDVAQSGSEAPPR